MGNITPRRYHLHILTSHIAYLQKLCYSGTVVRVLVRAHRAGIENCLAVEEEELMNPTVGRVLLIVGIVVAVAAVILHVMLTSVQVFPKFNVVLGVVGVIIAGIGVFGMVSKRRGA